MPNLCEYPLPPPRGKVLGHHRSQMLLDLVMGAFDYGRYRAITQLARGKFGTEFKALLNRNLRIGEFFLQQSLSLIYKRCVLFLGQRIAESIFLTVRRSKLAAILARPKRPCDVTGCVHLQAPIKHMEWACTKTLNAGMPERRNTKTRNTKLLKRGTHEK